MGSLQKRKHSSKWWIATTLPNGKRVFRSTKIDLADRDDAELYLANMMMAHKAARRGVLVETQAKRYLNTVLESVNESPMTTMRINKFLEEWLGEREQQIAPGSYIRYKGVVEAFEKYLGDTAKMPLSALTPRHFEGFRSLQMKQGRSATTANIALKILRSAFGEASKQGLMLLNPAAAVKYIRKVQESRDVFTVEQVELLLKACKKDWEWKGMIFLGVFTGMRLKDAARLTWGNIDTNTGVLTYLPSKTASRKNTPQRVKMAPQLWNFFKTSPVVGCSGKVPLFPTLAKKKVGGANGLSSLFNYIVKDAKIDRQEHIKPVKTPEKGKEGEPVEKSKGRKFYGLSFHSLRHTCTSLMANEGVSREVRMKIVGHTSDVHDLYTHLDPKMQEDAVAKMPTFKVS